MKKLIAILIAISLVFIVAAQYAKYFPDIIVTSVDGLWTDTRGYTSLAAAVAAIVADGTDDKNLYIINQETQSGNLTIPSYVHLCFLQTGEIYMSSGTLTVESRKISAPDKQIFNGGGDYDFADGTILRNAWFPTIDYVLDRTSSDSVIIEIVAPQTIADDATVGAGVTLKWLGPDSVLTLTAGKTLTVDGILDAGKYKILDVTAGVGGVDLDGIGTSIEYSAWYGDPSVVLAGAAGDVIWTKTLDDETAYMIWGYCLGQEVGGAGRAMYGRSTLVYRDGGGGATEQGTASHITPVESDNTWDCDFDVNGNDVRLLVDSDAANNTNWSYELHILAQDGS